MRNTRGIETIVSLPYCFLIEYFFFLFLSALLHSELDARLLVLLLLFVPGAQPSQQLKKRCVVSTPSNAFSIGTKKTKKRTVFINCIQVNVHYIVCMFVNTKPTIINHHLAQEGDEPSKQKPTICVC